jgi:hypothetical protein
MERYENEPMPAEVRAMYDSLLESAKTVRQLHDTCGMSKRWLYKMLMFWKSEECVEYFVSGTSTTGRPPRYWAFTEKGKLLYKQLKGENDANSK